MGNASESSCRIWTPDLLSQATEGIIFGQDWKATGVAIDSKEVQPGDLFVALKGERVDGHDFLLEAFQRGAVGFLIQEDPVVLAKKHQWSFPLSGVRVENTKEALWKAAQWVRKILPAHVIGITGSVGKTTTKALLGYLLGRQGTTFFDARSLNTKIGLALTLMRAAPFSQFGVVELGMNQPGEIAPLAKALKLDYAIITRIAPAHQWKFPDIEAIAHEKFSITQGLAPQGPLILDGDMPLFARLKKWSSHPLWSYGQSASMDLRLLDWHVSDREHMTVRAAFKGESPFEFVIQGIGYPKVMCALGALLAVKVMGASVERALQDIGEFPGVTQRGVVQRYPFSSNLLEKEACITIIDETYNASPASMEQALESLAAYQKAFGGRSMAVLGDMRELGDQSIDFHKQLAPKILSLGISGVFLCGPLMASLREVLPRELVFGYAQDAFGLAELLVHTSLKSDDAYMIKGSLSMNMAHIIDRLVEALEKKNG